MTPTSIDPNLKQLAREVGAAVVEELLTRLRAGDLLPVAPPYLTAHEVSQLTSISTKRLESWRSERKEIPYFKPSNGRVLYKRADVIAWVEKGGPMR
jgi:hypothetical protein